MKVTINSRAADTPEARAHWADVYPDLSEAKQGLFGSVTSRAEAQVLRLSLLYAVLDGAEQIELPHLKAALAFWDYCERSARWIFGTATGKRDADEIRVALLKAEARGMSATEISAEVFNRHRGSEQIGQALRLSARNGMAVCRENRRTGEAPSQRWYVVQHAPEEQVETRQ